MTGERSGGRSLERLGLNLGSFGAQSLVFLSLGVSLCRVTVVTWSPEEGVEVKARGGAPVVGEAGSVALGVGLHWRRTEQAGFWGVKGTAQPGDWFVITCI